MDKLIPSGVKLSGVVSVPPPPPYPHHPQHAAGLAIHTQKRHKIIIIIVI
jgi:hypothetical protein